MKANCLILDNGFYCSIDSKTIHAPKGDLIADLYHLDISKMSEKDIIELTICFSKAYQKGEQNATDEFKQKIQNFFDFKY